MRKGNPSLEEEIVYLEVIRKDTEGHTTAVGAVWTKEDILRLSDPDEPAPSDEFIGRILDNLARKHQRWEGIETDDILWRLGGTTLLKARRYNARQEEINNEYT